ncbi:Eukaryotic translation initiation factor 4E type 2 [Mortierella alpina]|nr:Eukaryotic translation initiation factor 4E type 2 [Mortierella alpina]
MDQAWSSRKSARAQGDSAPAASSKLVQLQRQSSSTGPVMASLVNAPSSTSATSHSSTLNLTSVNGPMIAGGALDFGSSRGDTALSGSKAGVAVSSGSASTTSGPSGFIGSGFAGAGALLGTGGTLSSGTSLHPLHFNWVFWFMHRTPGSKILNYESSMKKIATFGSVEDFWAVYSHLKRPHELPNVSDYHLFKQGVRPVWEDATNINGGKWIVRLKKGLASRYWENLVMAVIGDQFDVGSEICGIVLSIRGGEDILSLWNQSAHEGRINLKIRDTMKRILNLPADTIMEYKTHNDALKDNTSFRNTDVFSIFVQSPNPIASTIHLDSPFASTLLSTIGVEDHLGILSVMYLSRTPAPRNTILHGNKSVFKSHLVDRTTMPSSTRDLIPASISSFLNLTATGDSSTNNNNHDLAVGTVDPSPTELRVQLNKIPRKSWLKLGGECHNLGFASEIALTVVSKPTASSSMSISAMAAAKAAAAAGPALNLANGLPKIVETIQRRRQQHMSKVASPSSSSSSLSSDTQQPRALLWDMYFFYQDHCNSSINSNNHKSHARTGRAIKSKSASLSFSSSAPAAWQLQFLKSACPEVIVLAFADAFLEYGPKRGFVDRDVPTDLIQVLDYEWRSDSAPARRAVLALVQTMIACRRHVKAVNHNRIDPASSGTNPSSGITGLGAKREVSGSVAAAGRPQEDGDQQQQQQKAAFENGCLQLAKTLADACSSLEIFFTTETGRALPKLQSLLQQELAADIKAHSKTGPAGLERGVKRPAASSSSVGVMGGRDMGAAGPDALDPVTKKRLKETSSGSPSLLSRQGSNDSDSVKSSPALSSSSSSLSKGTGNEALEDQALMGTLLSTKHILERAQTGQLAANNAAQQQQPLLPLQQTAVTSSSLSSLGQQQQAKLSNPLWSPILGLNYLPQAPQKYMVQVEAELARWISLLGHMDGLVFNDKLTSLIRAVYPSDQKFLLDLLLIEYMSWEGTEGQELLDADRVAAPSFLEDAFHHHQVTNNNNNNKSTAGPDGNKNNKGSTLKSGEWILEVILGAFVGLVMKPEDSNTHLEPGSKKWSESIEILEDEDEDEVDDGGTEVVGGGSKEVSKTTATTTFTTASAVAVATGIKPSNSTTTSVETGTSSATTTPARPSVAMGGGSAMMAKKRRMRTLYNRRVSPFYATLLMFQPKRVVGRVQGVLYLSHEELDSSQQEVSSNPGAGGVAGKDAEALLKQATETAHQLKTSLAVDKTEPSPEEQIRSRMELKKLRRQQRKAHKRGRYAKKIDLDADPDAQAASSSHNSHGMAGKWRDKTKSDYDAELDMHDDEKESAAGHPTGATSTSASINNTAKREDERKDVVMSEAGDDGGHAELDLDVLSASLAFNPQDHYQGWMEETLEEDELLLAKRAETARVVCHAPFKVLMFILQYLTRMNQAGALDAWITDALSGTAFVLQVHYFEWVLSTLLLPKKVTGRSPTAASSLSSTRPATKGVAADGVVLLEEELLRLLALLIAAPGIGHKPVKTARSIVEQTLHHLQDHSMEDASESEYWKRVKAMLEGH